ncbi:hypothetical protein D3C80_2240790 [compost metagenome]
MVITTPAGQPMVRHKDAVRAGVDHYVGVRAHSAANAFDGVAGVHVGFTQGQARL